MALGVVMRASVIAAGIFAPVVAVVEPLAPTLDFPME